LLQPIIPKSIMKRIILLLFAVVISFSSCENLEDNSPGFQSEVDSVFFRAQDIRGIQNEDGTFTLQGITGGRKLTLNIEKSQLGRYELGPGRASSASYEDPSDDVYSTNPFGEGSIEITDRCISCGWLTGSFQFNAKRSESDSISVNVRKGFFFEVSFIDGLIDTGLPSDNTMTATVNDASFSATNVTAAAAGASLVIVGSDASRTISITVPADAVSGNYSIGTTGYNASVTVNGVTTQAETGLISVNFNDTSTGSARIFFEFEAGDNTVTIGNTRVEYQ